ncbi:chondroitin proteoglycan 2-like isoform X1 [Uloborus diversus]|uniref:chondroitin proteoglycan 2-like isoform X1 n=1 Tax=Uloborus diversus TaxID=327109 RepID=UPI0024093637|nr:chondroitin proteoglycan 2-like isoform X1 [Uloborus diversus]
MMCNSNSQRLPSGIFKMIILIFLELLAVCSVDYVSCSILRSEERVFSERNNWNQYSSVSCPSRTSGTPVLIPHPDNCQKFYLCDNGTPYLRSCQSGLHFNSKIQACDYPENVNCESVGFTRSPLGKIKEEESVCPSGKSVLLPHHQECEKFITCEKGVAHLQSCPKGLHFNPKKQICDYPEEAGCLNSVTDKPVGKLGEDETHSDCPSGNSEHPILLPHETDCGKFYTCDGGRKHTRSCQAGLHFNPKINACDYPKNAKCDRAENEEPKGRINDPVLEICSSDTTGRPFLLSHPTECEKFYVCDSGNAFLQNCPTGLHFNLKLGACDFPEIVQCDTGFTRSPLGKIKEEGSVCPSGKSVLLPHHQECEKFITCEKGVAHLQSCPKGLHFNPKKQICDYPNEAGCLNSIQRAPGFPTPFCPSFNGKIPIFFRHQTNCSVYYMCSNGLAYEFTCPARLHFNLRKRSCDYESDANCQPGEVVD